MKVSAATATFSPIQITSSVKQFENQNYLKIFAITVVTFE